MNQSSIDQATVNEIGTEWRRRCAENDLNLFNVVNARERSRRILREVKEEYARDQRFTGIHERDGSLPER